MNKSAFPNSFYRLLFLLLTIFSANQILAATCPDLSNSDQIPGDWQIFESSPAKPTAHNQFYQAIYDYKLSNMYTAHRVICAYHTDDASFFALISNNTYFPPTDPLWLDHKEFGVYICRQQAVENCPF